VADAAEPVKRLITMVSGSRYNKVMEAIGEKCGLHSEAQGIVISIPVDAVTGLGKTLRRFMSVRPDTKRKGGY